MRIFLFLISMIIGLLFSSHVFSADKWLLRKNGQTGKDPVSSGKIIGYGEFLVCRAKTPHGTLPGHLIIGQSVCAVAWGDSSGSFSRYEVLQRHERYKWVHPDQVTDIGELVYVGTQNNTKQRNYVCQRPDGWAGRLQGGIGDCCWIAWSDENKCLVNYNVLVPK